jgi:polyhydroxyalkanoate synthesis regulator phasin
MTEITVEEVRELIDKYSKATPTTNEEAKKLVHEMANAFPAMAALIIKMDAENKRLQRPVYKVSEDGSIECLDYTKLQSQLTAANALVDRLSPVNQEMLEKMQGIYDYATEIRQTATGENSNFAYVAAGGIQCLIEDMQQAILSAETGKGE